MSNFKRFIFPLIYTLLFIGIIVVSFVGSSKVTVILLVSLVSAMFIAAFVQEFTESRALSDIILNSAVYLGGLLFFLLFIFVGGIVIFLTLVYAVVIAAVVMCRFAFLLRRDCTEKPNIKRGVAVAFPIFIITIAVLNVEFENDLLWAWALIPAGILIIAFGAAAFILLKPVWGKIYQTKAKSIANAVAFTVIAVLLIYYISAMGLATANCAFDSESQKTEYTVTEKKATLSSRAPDDYDVKVIIDGKEVWIPVTSDEYGEIEEGDTIVVNRHSGALGFAYYSFEGYSD